MAAIDIDNHTAFHLEAVQTIAGKDQSLSDWYADIITERKTQLLELSSYLVADGWFAKRTFVDQVINADMHLISRLRDDANLRYLHQGEPTGRPGRPKKYDRKVDNKDIDLRYFDLVSKDDLPVIYTAVVHSISLKRNIKVVHALYCNEKGKQVYKLYFSSDINMDASDILKFYQSRFVFKLNFFTVTANSILA